MKIYHFIHDIFGHPILGCSWKFYCVIRYYLNVEQLNIEFSFLKLKCLSFQKHCVLGRMDK